jgi:hypothetical protein
MSANGCPWPPSVTGVIIAARHGALPQLFRMAVGCGYPSRVSLTSVSRGCFPRLSVAAVVCHRPPSRLSITAVRHMCPAQPPHVCRGCFSQPSDAHAPYGHSTPRSFRTGTRDTATPLTAAPHTAAPPMAPPRTRNPRGTRACGHSAIRDVRVGPSHNERMLFVPKSEQTWCLRGDHASGCGALGFDLSREYDSHMLSGSPQCTRRHH